MSRSVCTYSYLFVVVIHLITGSFVSVASAQNEPDRIIPAVNKTEPFCPELFSTSLQIDCFYEGNVTSCDEPMANGTIAKVKCKHSYYRNYLPYEELSCRNGSWNYPFLFNCEPVCGIKYTKWIPFVVKGTRAKLGDFPWHVGLYIKRNRELIHLCGGTILSPKFVITAAHCFESLDARLYAVAAGKIYREWKNENDKFAQFRNVIEILIQNKYKGESTGFAADIAILILKNIFILSDLVQPICVDYTSTIFDVAEINQGNVPGWGLTSENGNRSDILQYATLPLRSFDDCLQIVPNDFIGQVTLDKVCAGYTNGTSVCEGDSGGGLVYPRMINGTELRYTLIGVVSTGPFNRGTCDSYQYTTFTTVAAHIQWINHTRYKYENWSPYDYGCYLPEYPGFGTYTVDADVPGGGTELGPGTLVPQYTKLRYSCNPGHRVYGNEIATCKELVWNVNKYLQRYTCLSEDPVIAASDFTCFTRNWNVNDYLPRCYKTCPRLKSTDLDIEYVSENVNVTQDDGTIWHETKALFRCKNRNYELEEPANKQTTCIAGRWTLNVPMCKPICGVKERHGKTNYAADGVSERFPWNVGIYRKTCDSYQLQCAGTIISSFVILTGSGCVSQKEISQYVVVAGSSNKNFNSLTDEHQQVTTIFKTFAYDYFDIIISKKRFNVTSSVLPVCFSPARIPSTEDQLVIPFWSDDEDNLKTMLYEGKDIEDDDLKNSSIPTNIKAAASGALVFPVSFSSGSRYYLAGFGTIDELQNIGIYVLIIAELDFIARVLEKYNTELNEMNECVVPDAGAHVKTIDFNYHPGDIVLEGTRIKYICDAWFDLYGTKEIVCANGTWSYPKGKPYCIGCGVSQLDPTRFDSSISTNFTVKADKFPWRADIYAINNGHERRLSGGSIISSRAVLTFIFWKERLNKKEVNSTVFAVRVGNYNLNSSLNNHLQEIAVDDIVEIGNVSKIAIFILAKEIVISEHVLPICWDTLKLTSSTQTQSALSGMVPYGDIMNGNGNSSRTNLLYLTHFSRVINASFDRIIVLHEKQMICSSNEYWNDKLRGMALAIKYPTDGGDRYFLQYIFNFFFCKYKRFYFYDMSPLVSQIESLLNKYN